MKRHGDHEQSFERARGLPPILSFRCALPRPQGSGTDDPAARRRPEHHPPRWTPVHLEGREPGPHAELILKDYRFARRLLAAGEIGFGEGYLQGEWDSPKLETLIELMSVNRAVIDEAMPGQFWQRVMQLLAHALNRNTRFRCATEYPRSLRSGQRFLPDLARQHDDLFLGCLRAGRQ